MRIQKQLPHNHELTFNIDKESDGYTIDNITVVRLFKSSDIPFGNRLAKKLNKQQKNLISIPDVKEMIDWGKEKFL